jgi:hypothetical protein
MGRASGAGQDDADAAGGQIFKQLRSKETFAPQVQLPAQGSQDGLKKASLGNEDDKIR